MQNLDPLREELLKTDESFRNLFEEHQEYKQRLTEIRSKTLLSEEDETEIKRIKLHKLSLKDRMEQIVRDHRSSAPVA